MDLVHEWGIFLSYKFETFFWGEGGAIIFGSEMFTLGGADFEDPAIKYHSNFSCHTKSSQG